MWACEGRDFEDGEDSESRIKVALPAKSGRPPESARLVPHKLGRGIRGTGYRKVGANALPTGPNSCGFDTGVRVFFHSPLRFVPRHGPLPLPVVVCVGTTALLSELPGPSRERRTGPGRLAKLGRRRDRASGQNAADDGGLGGPAPGSPRS